MGEWQLFGTYMCEVESSSGMGVGVRSAWCAACDGACVSPCYAVYEWVCSAGRYSRRTTLYNNTNTPL